MAKIGLGMAALWIVATSAGAAEAAAPRGAVGQKTVAVGKGWSRFVTRKGQDLSLRLERPGARLQGRVILGRTQATGDRGAWKGGAAAHVVDVTLTQKAPGLLARLRGRGGVTMRGKAPWQGRFQLALQGPAGQAPQRDAVHFSSVKLQRKERWFKPWRTVFEGHQSELAVAPADFDRSPIEGADAKEIVGLLEDAGAPYIDIDGADFRGLRAAPYFTQGGEHYHVSLDGLQVPSQLADALDGLRSLGLRPDHPIFSRLPR